MGDGDRLNPVGVCFATGGTQCAAAALREQVEGVGRILSEVAEVGAVEAISRKLSNQFLGIGLPKVTRAEVVGGQRGKRRMRLIALKGQIATWKSDATVVQQLQLSL